MEILVGLFFIGVGSYMIWRTDAWIRKTHEGSMNRAIDSRVADTAYGRWFARIEPAFTRVFGAAFIVIGLVIVTGLWPWSG